MRALTMSKGTGLPGWQVAEDQSAHGRTGTTVLVSRDSRLGEVVASVAASVGVEVTTLTGREGVERAWRQPGPVLVGQDCACLLVPWHLPERNGVHVVGRDAEEAARWSAVLGASVIVVPASNATLGEVLREETRTAASAVVVAVGQASGGVGASTLAAGLAGAGSLSGWRSAVVELDPAGGGADLLLGAERQPGWRWPELASTRGVVSDLGAHLPQVDGVWIVSTGRDRCPVPPTARAAVVDSLAADLDLVVLDRGRLGDDEMAGLQVDHHLEVVGADLRSLLAARHRSTAEVVLRRGPGRRMTPADAAEVLGRESVTVVHHDNRVARALESGEAPWVMASRRWRRTCHGLVEGVMGRG